MTPRELHRRRRLRALAAVAVGATVAGAVVGSGDGGDARPGPEPTLCTAPGARALARVAGQTVIVRMAGRAGPELLGRARRGQIGGVVLFPPAGIRGGRLAAQLADLQAAAAAGDNPRLLVAIDQEGGPVERLPALPPRRSPRNLAAGDDPEAARAEGAATGSALRTLGIDVDLAPVLDVPSFPGQFMAPRAFGASPDQVATLGTAFAEGLRSEAVAATAKHFPGLGRALENTDLAPTSIDAARRSLEADIAPFRAAVEQGVDLVMMSSATYPRLGSPQPAVLARELVTGLLREELGFDGVITSDDLLAPAIRTQHQPRRAALLAARAGVDLLLFAARPGPSRLAAGLARAVAAGHLDEAALRASCARVVALKEALASGAPLG